MNVHARGAIRTRWAAIGAALAISIGGGSIAISQAAVSSGVRSVYVPIAPCRVFDTRAGDVNVGRRSTPLAAGETYTQQITGANGNCTAPIPTDATAVAMNVTTVGGTAGSFLTIWPSDVARPLTSSLNWIPGSPPTPNKVDSKLSPTGQINLFNNAGDVDVLADIVGYYTDHDHDDRYYPRAETYSMASADVQFTTKAQVVAAPYSHLLAGGVVLGDGSTISDRTFGNVQTSRIGTGQYALLLPGYNIGCTNAGFPFVTATLVDTPIGFVVMDGGVQTNCGSGNTTLFVETVNTSSISVDHAFAFAMYAG